MEQIGKPRNKPIHLPPTNISQGSQAYSMEKRQSLQINDAGKIGYSHVKMKLDPYLLPLKTKINLKQIKGLNVKLETKRLLEKNIENKLLDVGLGNEFLDMRPKAQATKQKSISRMTSN